MDIKIPILLVTSSTEMFEEAQIRLSRVGFDNILGTIDGGINTWIDSGRETESVNNINPSEFIKTEKNNIIDVRKPSEYDVASYSNALNLSLFSLTD